MIHRNDTLTLSPVDEIINSEGFWSEKKIGIPRASSIDKVCIRCCVLMAKNPIVKAKEYVSGDLNLIFEWGNAFHSSAQNTPALIKDKYRRGWYQCQACEKILGFGGVPSKTFECKYCKAKRSAIIYYEHKMEVNKPFYLTGHPDLFVELIENELTITELKTMSGKEFKALEKPLAEHVIQVTSYMIGMPHDESKLVIPKKYKINTESAIIIYVTKEAISKDIKPRKAFRVKRNKVFEGMIMEKLMSFKKGFENYPKDLPECEPLCIRNNFQSGTSKDCPAINLCKNAFFKGN